MSGASLSARVAPQGWKRVAPARIPPSLSLAPRRQKHHRGPGWESGRSKVSCRTRPSHMGQQLLTGVAVGLRVPVPAGVCTPARPSLTPRFLHTLPSAWPHTRAHVPCIHASEYPSLSVVPTRGLRAAAEGPARPTRVGVLGHAVPRASRQCRHLRASPCAALRVGPRDARSQFCSVQAAGGRGDSRTKA